MNSLGKYRSAAFSLFFCATFLGACASPPPPPPAAPPPTPQRTCDTSEATDVLGDVRADGQITRVTTTTRCVTQ
jgi:hypothetical protein